MTDEVKEDEETLAWVDKQTELMDKGTDLVKEASAEALEYVVDAIENINDKQWRKMVMETQALQMGVGIALAEHVVPNIYDDMRKNLHKKLKIGKEGAEALRHIYIGRLVKNIERKLDEQ